MGKFRPSKAGYRQYKRGIPTCRVETYHMYSQDKIYEEFKILPGFRQNETEFHPDQPGSCNHHLRVNRIIQSIILLPTSGFNSS